MRFFLTLVASAVLAYVLSLILTIQANPEIRFWRDVQLRRQAEIESARQADPARPVILFTGGSSTAFSIDPAIVEEACKMPAFNLALPVSAGAHYLIHQALQTARPGDILVLGLEADMIATELDYPASMLSLGLGVFAGKPSDAVGGETFNATLEPREALTLARPGPRYLMTLAFRSASGKGYRYTPADYRYHGRMETPEQDPQMTANDVLQPRKLSDSGRQLLLAVRDAADKKGVKLLYTMPWRLTSVENAEVSRLSNAALQDAVNPIITVIDDGTRGVATERGFFSDSPQHLTASGSAARSRAMAAKLSELLKQEGNEAPEEK